MTDIDNLVMKDTRKQDMDYAQAICPTYKESLRQLICEAKEKSMDLLILSNGIVYSAETKIVVSKREWNAKLCTFEISKSSKRKKRFQAKADADEIEVKNSSERIVADSDEG